MVLEWKKRRSEIKFWCVVRLCSETNKKKVHVFINGLGVGGKRKHLSGPMLQERVL